MVKKLLGNLKELFSPFFALKDHAHGLITKDGTISGQASKNVVTDSNGKITTEAKPTIPSANATATNIKMNGTQSAGSLTTFAKADHVHPVDTSRAAASHTHDDRYYTETEVNTKLSDYLTTDDASATYQPKGSYLTSHNPIDTALSSTSTNAVQNKVINTALSGKANSSHTHHDTDIDWNGSALAGMVSPVDMAMYREFNANRLAYLDGDNITIEYSTNGGSTWTAMGTATEKLKLVTTVSNFKAGNGSRTDYSKNQVRVTIKMGDVGVNSSIYMTTRKIMLYLCTCGASGTKCQISTSTYKAPTTFTNVGSAVGVTGYSGWNSIPLNVMLGGYANQVGSSSDRIQNLRLTFTQTGGTGNLDIQKIRLFGETAWAVPSNMASEGDLYSYDENQNATFSNKITSTGFVKSGGTSSQFLKADGSVDSNNYIKTSSTSGYIKNDGTVGTPTNTTYSADNSTLQLSSTTFSVKDGGITNAKLADKSSLITEYIVGTQTSSTSAWTGKATKITSLAAGQVIYYKLPYASTSTYVTLNLTLADGSTTGAKEVWFWNGVRLNTHYGVNSVIGLVYNGSQWWVINPSSNNTNTYLTSSDYFTSGEALTNQNLIACKKADNKYYKINTLKNTVINISRPLLLSNGNVNANTNSGTSIIFHPWVVATNLNGGTSLTLSSTVYQPVYLEGTAYSNGEFTVSNTPITQILTSGRFYIMIGVAYNTTVLGVDLTRQTVYYYNGTNLIESVSWNGVVNKPTTFTPSSHTHGNLTNDGKIGSTANLPVITGTNGVLQASSFGTSANTFCQGNDSRLTNARTPTAHTDSSGAYGKATTSVWGHTKLSSATNSTDETMSATPKAVKTAYDLANGKPSLGTTATTAAKGNHTHSGYASSTHTHDDRYFTETEVNTKLNDYLTESDAANTYLTSHNPIDTALSSTSTNAVQNKVVNTALSGKVAVSQGKGNSGKFLKVNSSGNVACESVTIPSAYTHPASHPTTMIVEPNALDNIGTSAAIAQANVNAAINTKIGELLENKILIAKVFSDTTPSIASENATNRTFNVPELPDEYSWVFIPTKCNYGNISSSSLDTDTNILTVRVVNLASSSHGVTYAGILVYYHNSLKL